MKPSPLFRSACIALACAISVSCSQSPAPNASAVKPPTAQTSRAPGNGAPQIALSADMVHIEYRVYGQGEPALVFVHGWSCDANYWQAQIDALSPRHTVVVLNLAGHGSSGANRTNWTMKAFGDDVDAVVRALPNEKVVLVGHSMGGPVVLEAARQLPGRVLAVVGVDTFATIGTPLRPLAETELRVAGMRQDFIGFMRDFVPNRMFAPGADPAFVRKVTDDMALAPPEVAIPAMVALDQYDYAPPLAEVRVPIIAINSDLNGVTDEARIKKLAPTFRLRTMAGRGHFLMMEDAAGFDAVLEEELALVRGAAPRS